MANRGYMPKGSGARRIRSPSTPFYLRQRPYEIQPIACIPVLAGETLKGLTYQIRAVTDPIKNPLIGWHYEVYWFYCKMSDLIADTDFLFDPASTETTYLATASETALYLKHTAANGQINWMRGCYESIVSYWFRDDNEGGVIGASAPLLAKRTSKDVWDSAALTSAIAALDPVITVGVDDSFSAQEVEDLMSQWQLARMSGLTDMTYNDYLISQGVKLPDEEIQTEFRPELVRYQREWQYPSNTIDPTTGAPTSAVSWAVAGRADKDRFFKEPGFLMGLSCVRPKIYLKGQHGSMLGFLNNAERWLPRQLLDKIELGWMDLAAADNVADNTAAWTVDLRDLFEYGEQFTNLDVDGTHYFNQIDMSDLDTLGRYPASADINGLFVSGTEHYVRSDGVADYKIATAVPRDPLPGSDARI